MVIVGAEEEEYRLTVDDIDSSLVFMYTPVTEEGAKGEPQYKYTDFVKAGLHGCFFETFVLRNNSSVISMVSHTLPYEIYLLLIIRS